MREIPVAELDTLPSGALTHTASVAAFLATFMGYLPAILAIIPALYYVLLIYESKTVQGWVEARRARRRVINVAKAQAAALVATTAAKTAVDEAKK